MKSLLAAVFMSVISFSAINSAEADWENWGSFSWSLSENIGGEQEQGGGGNHKGIGSILEKGGADAFWDHVHTAVPVYLAPGGKIDIHGIYNTNTNVGVNTVTRTNADGSVDQWTEEYFVNSEGQSCQRNNIVGGGSTVICK